MNRPNIRMHLAGYSGLCPLPPAGNAGRSAHGRRGRGAAVLDGAHRKTPPAAATVRSTRRRVVYLSALILALVAFGPPLALEAQEAAKVWRIGLLFGILA